MARGDKVFLLPLKVGDRLGSYVITANLYKGGRGNTFLAVHDKKPGQEVVIKVPSIDPTRTKNEIEKRLGDVAADMAHELTAWRALSKNKVIKPYLAAIIARRQIEVQVHPDGESHLLTYLIQEYIRGRRLEDYCKDEYTDKIERGSFQGMDKAEAWFTLAKKLVWIVSVIHQSRVIHADIWPPNIIIRENGEPVLIDFGQSWLAERIHQDGHDKKRYAYYAPERQMEERRTWYAPVDVYGISGVLFYLATGKDPVTPYREPFDQLYEKIMMNESLSTEEDQLLRDTPTEDKFKTKTELRQQLVGCMINNGETPELYQENFGIPDIILYGLRPMVEERAFSAIHLLDLLEVFEQSARSGEPQHPVYAPLKLPRVTLNQPALSQPAWQGQRDIYARLLDYDLRGIGRQRGLVDARTRYYALPGGNRDDLVNHLLVCFSALQKGDHLFALTTATFWFRYNFGMKGRLLSALKIAAKIGVTIRWVTVVSPGDLGDLSSVVPSLEAQREAVQEIHQIDHKIAITKRDLHDTGFYMGYTQVTDKEKESLIRKTETFLSLQQVDGREPCFTFIAPTYITAGGMISSLRLWQGRAPGLAQASWSEREVVFNKLLMESKNVRDYQRESAESGK